MPRALCLDFARNGPEEAALNCLLAEVPIGADLSNPERRIMHSQIFIKFFQLMSTLTLSTENSLWLARLSPCVKP